MMIFTSAAPGRQRWYRTINEDRRGRRDGKGVENSSLAGQVREEVSCMALVGRRGGHCCRPRCDEHYALNNTHDLLVRTAIATARRIRSRSQVELVRARVVLA